MGTSSSEAAAQTVEAAPKLKIGFVHAGRPPHGVIRYGQILAAEAGRRSDIELMQVDVAVPERGTDVRGMIAAARRLRGCDVVHLQFNVQRTGCVWGRGWRQLLHLAAFLLACRPPVVCTIHDLYPIAAGADIFRLVGLLAHAVFVRGASALGLRTAAPSRRVLALIADIRHATGIPGLPLRLLVRRASRVFVCSETERERLIRLVDAKRVRVIAHFVEERAPLPSRDDARKELGLEQARVVTLLGYVHPRKGHLLAIEALGRLPSEFVLIFAGGPPPRGEAFVDRLMTSARNLNVEHRVRVTGYLTETQLNVYLAATDVPICPFRAVAASGTMSTWISAARPFLSADLPLVHEYNRIAGDVIAIYSPDTPDALADGIRRFSETSGRNDPRMTALRRALEVSAVFEAHTREYLDSLGTERLVGHAIAVDHS